MFHRGGLGTDTRQRHKACLERDNDGARRQVPYHGTTEAAGPRPIPCGASFPGTLEHTQKIGNVAIRETRLLSIQML